MKKSFLILLLVIFILPKLVIAGQGEQKPSSKQKSLMDEWCSLTITYEIHKNCGLLKKEVIDKIAKQISIMDKYLLDSLGSQQWQEYQKALLQEPDSADILKKVHNKTCDDEVVQYLAAFINMSFKESSKIFEPEEIYKRINSAN